MAQATDVTTAAVRPGAASAKGRAPARFVRSVDAETPVKDETVANEPPGKDEPFTMDAPDSGRVTMLEASHAEPPVEEEPEDTESPADGEDDDANELPETEETAVGHATVPIERVNALLSEALRLGLQYHLVEKQPDGTFLLAGQSRTTRRESSDCTCQQCTPHAQQHWICVVCHSGPHDWLMVKPQYERQALKPGGIEGTRHAACSAQCARDYLSTLGRQPSGVPLGRGIDPTLALP